MAAGGPNDDDDNDVDDKVDDDNFGDFDDNLDEDIDEVVANEGAPIAPPGAAPGAPPKPPPLPGQKKSIFTAETLRLKVELEKARDELQARIDAGDVNAKEEYKKLKALHNTNWQLESKNKVTTPSILLTQKEAEVDKLKGNLAAQLKPLRDSYKYFKASIKTIREQKAQIAQIPNSELVLERMNSIIDEEYPAQLAQLIRDGKALKRQTVQDVKKVTKAIKTLEADIKRAKVDLKQLEALRNVFPRSEKEMAKGDAPGKARKFDLNEWEQKGFFTGIYFANLKRFIILRDHANDIEDNYSPKQVKKVYNAMINLAGLNELIIMGIATGYITRDFNDNDKMYLNNALNPLENTIRVPQLELFLQSVMNKFYEGFPDLKETAPIDVADGAKIDMGAITTYIEQSVKKGNDPDRSIGHAHATTAPSASSSSSSSSTTVKQPSAARRALAEREEQGQAAAKTGGKTQKGLLKRGKEAGLDDLQKEADQVFADLDNYEKRVEVHADGLVKRIQDSLNELAQELGLDVNKSGEELAAETLLKVKELKEKAETPQAVIDSEWGKDKQGALQHAWDLAKRKGTPLKDLDLLKMVPSSDRNLAAQLLSRLKK